MKLEVFTAVKMKLFFFWGGGFTAPCKLIGRCQTSSYFKKKLNKNISQSGLMISLNGSGPVCDTYGVFTWLFLYYVSHK